MSDATTTEQNSQTSTSDHLRPPSSSSSPIPTTSSPSPSPSASPIPTLRPSSPSPSPSPLPHVILLQHRLSQFEYLMRVHMGLTLWMNTALLSPSTLALSLSSQSLNNRVYHYLILGLSLGRVYDEYQLLADSTHGHQLHSSASVSTVMGMMHVLQEYDYYQRHHDDQQQQHYHHSHTQRSRDLHTAIHSSPESSADRHKDMSMSSVMQTYSGTGTNTAAPAFPTTLNRHTVFSALLIPPSFSSTPQSSNTVVFSHHHTVLALLHILTQLYSILLTIPVSSLTIPIVQQLFAADARVKHLVISPMADDCTVASLYLIQTEKKQKRDYIEKIQATYQQQQQQQLQLQQQQQQQQQQRASTSIQSVTPVLPAAILQNSVAEIDAITSIWSQTATPSPPPPPPPSTGSPLSYAVPEELP